MGGGQGATAPWPSPHLVDISRSFPASMVKIGKGCTTRRNLSIPIFSWGNDMTKRIIGTAVGALAGFLIGYLSRCTGTT